MDTVRKTSTSDNAIAKTTILSADSSLKRGINQTDSATFSRMENKENISGSTDTAALATANASTVNTVSVKNNNVIWKEYIDSVTSTLKIEVMPSKKIKNGTYYVSVSYAIGTDGQVTINNVLVTPDNSFLQQQVKERIAIDAPRLSPALTSTGIPRKSSKNYNFTLSQ